eukprot:g2129.t1
MNASDALKLLLKAPSKGHIERVFDQCFRRRHDIEKVDCADFAEDIDEDEEDVLELYKVIHKMISQALYHSPLKEEDYLKIFPKGDVDMKLKKLISKIIRSRLELWREVSTNQRISLPHLVDFDWRLDFKASSNRLNQMGKPSALLNIKVQEQPQRVDEMPEVRAVDFEMDKSTLEVVLGNLSEIRDRLISAAVGPSQRRARSQEFGEGEGENAVDVQNSDGREGNLFRASAERRIRKRGILEVRSAALWKPRLVELENGMLVVYKMLKGASDGPIVKDGPALREFFVGSPKESLDLYDSITIHFADNKGNHTIRLSSSKSSRVFTLTSDEATFNFRAATSVAKKQWFDAISSSRITDSVVDESLLLPVHLGRRVHDNDTPLVAQGYLLSYDLVALGALHVWRERFISLDPLALKFYKAVRKSINGASLSKDKAAPTSAPVSTFSLGDIVVIRESRMRSFAFSVHVQREEKKQCRVLCVAASSEEERVRWMRRIRQALANYPNSLREKKLAEKTERVGVDPIMTPDAAIGGGGGTTKKKDAESIDHLGSILRDVFIPEIGTTTPMAPTPPIRRTRPRRWRHSVSDEIEGWNYRLLTLPREGVQQQQMWMSVANLPLPSVSFTFFGKKATIGTPSNDKRKQVELNQQRIWAYVEVSALEPESEDLVRLGKSDICSLHSVSVVNKSIGTCHDVLDVDFNVAMLIEADVSKSDVRFVLHLACDNLLKKEPPPLSAFSSFAETQCSMRMIQDQRVELTLVRAVEKRNYKSTGVYTLGQLVLRPVTPCLSRLHGLCGNAPNYVGTVEQKYHRLPTTADEAPALLPTPSVKAALDKSKALRPLDVDFATNESRLKRGKRPWTIVERLHEPTCVLHVPAAFISFRAREMRLRRRRLQLWAQALARALGHFSQSASEGAADADARAAGWSIVRVAVVKGRGMRLNFDASNSFVRVRFEPHYSTRRSPFKVGETNIEFGTASPEWGSSQFGVPPVFKHCVLKGCRALSACARMDESGSTASDSKSAWVFYAPPQLRGIRQRSTAMSNDAVRRRSGLSPLLDVATSMAMDIGGRWRLLPGNRRYVSRNKAVAWLLSEQHAVDPKDALDLGQAMLEAGYIHRVDRAGTFRDDAPFLDTDDEDNNDDGGAFCFGDLVLADTPGSNCTTPASRPSPSPASSPSSASPRAARDSPYGFGIPKSSPISIPLRKRSSGTRTSQLRRHRSSGGSPGNASSPFSFGWYQMQRRSSREKARRISEGDARDSRSGGGRRTLLNPDANDPDVLGWISMTVYDVRPHKQGSSLGAPKMSFQKDVIGQLRLPVVAGKRMEGWYALQGGSSAKARSLTGTYAGEVYIRLVVEPLRPTKRADSITEESSTGNAVEDKKRRVSLARRRKLRVLSEVAARIIDTHCVACMNELAGEDLVKKELVLATVGAANAAAKAERYEIIAKKYAELAATLADVGKTTIGGFKKSVDKGSCDLMGVPTNLHVHTIRVLSPKISSNKDDGDGRQQQNDGRWSSASVVTLGAPSAHALGLKKGLRRLFSRASKQGVMDGDESPGPLHFAVRANESPLLDKNDFDIENRMDVAVSQAIAAATASFVSEFERCLFGGPKGMNMILQMSELGFLCHFESLLTAAKGEMSMVEDAEPAISALAMFAFRLVSVTTSAGGIRPYSVHTEGDTYVIHVYVKERIYQMVPSIAKKNIIRIVPAMFQQGINEVARLSDALGGAGGKEEVRINRASLRRILAYSSAVCRWEDNRATVASPVRSARYGTEMGDNLVDIGNRIDQIKLLEKNLIDAVCDDKAWSRNVEVLLRAAPLVRALGGGRLTFCKSGKDRTAMSVTLELASVVYTDMSLDRRGAMSSSTPLSADMFFSPPAALQNDNDSEALLELANLLREYGVRLPNCHKNTGKNCYAFNMIQRRMLPPMYRPPNGTYDSIFRKLRT